MTLSVVCLHIILTLVVRPSQTLIIYCIVFYAGLNFKTDIVYKSVLLGKEAIYNITEVAAECEPYVIWNKKIF